jgi:hypothetical protein
MRRIEVSDELWTEIPAHLLEGAVDCVGQATCPVCKRPIDIGVSPASMLAYIEPEGPISLALTHRSCSDSRIIAATAQDHPSESIDTAAAMRWRAHLRLRRPGAMLLWDDLDTRADGPRVLGSILGELGFAIAVEPLEHMTPPMLNTLGAALRGDDLSLIISDPEVPEPELTSFPDVTGGPWVEQARLDQAIVVVYGRLQLGKSGVELVDDLIEKGEVLAAVLTLEH